MTNIKSNVLTFNISIIYTFRNNFKFQQANFAVPLGPARDVIPAIRMGSGGKISTAKYRQQRAICVCEFSLSLSLSLTYTYTSHTYTHTHLMQPLVWCALLSGAGDAILCINAYLTAHPLEWLSSDCNVVTRRKAKGPLKWMQSWQIRLRQCRRQWTSWELCTEQKREPAERARERERRASKYSNMGERNELFKLVRVASKYKANATTDVIHKNANMIPTSTLELKFWWNFAYSSSLVVCNHCITSDNVSQDPRQYSKVVGVK